jgi:4-azaleucine resistance transporter AzlC
MIDFFKKKFSLFEAFNETNPVMLGYIPIGIAFGLLYSEIDMHWIWAVVMSVIVYSGSLQLLVVPMLLENSTLIDIGIVALLLNLRHVFFGLSFIETFSKFSFFKKNYMIFGLTDEVYSLLTTTKKALTESYMFSIVFLCHLYWIVGTAIGAFLGHLIPYDLSFLSFSLIALFIVLTIEQAKQVKTIKPFLVSGVSCFAAILLFPQYMLIIALFFTVIYFVVEYSYAKQ